jgi:uncharacterized membrane protein YczE
MVGLAIYGLGISMMVTAHIGIAPWDIFAQGLSYQLQISYGWASIIVSMIVLLCWIPLKIKPGVGTVLNAIGIGLFVDIWMPFVPKFTNLTGQYLEFIFGMVVVAFATGMYIGSNLGSGPRDGLMVGTQKLLGWPFWLVRTMYEATVLIIGWLMGGNVGAGTLIFAACIGYLMQISMKFFGVPLRKRK